VVLGSIAGAGLLLVTPARAFTALVPALIGGTCSASAVASMRAGPCARREARQSAIQTTCCSMDTTMLLMTDGLP
jgi:hypothetical protein